MIRIRTINNNPFFESETRRIFLFVKIILNNKILHFFSLSLSLSWQYDNGDDNDDIHSMRYQTSSIVCVVAWTNFSKKRKMKWWWWRMFNKRTNKKKSCLLLDKSTSFCSCYILAWLSPSLSLSLFFSISIWISNQYFLMMNITCCDLRIFGQQH